jgi:glutaredoxin
MSVPAQPRVEVYSTSTCADCIRSRRFLEAHGFAYAFHDIADDPALAQFVQAANARLGVPRLMRIPVIMVGERLLSEPSDAELAAALGVEL